MKMKREKKKYVHGKAYEWSRKEIEDIVNLYGDKNKSIRKIAKLYDVNFSTIRKLLKDNNVKLNRMGRKNLYSANYNYFDEIDTENKAYWLGFIAADGCVYKAKYSKGLRISLSAVDKNHLVKFKKDINSDYPVNEKNNIVGTYIFNNHLVENLKKYNIHFNKSFDITSPNLNRDMMKYFWRGYIDGDGCLRMGKNKQWSLSLISSSINIMENFRDFVKIYCNTKAKILNKKSPSKKDVYTFSICGNRMAFKIINLLYRNSNIYLDRKYEKYLEMCEFLEKR